MLAAIEQSKDPSADPAKLEPIERANVKKAYDAYSAIVMEMVKTNKDPFTGIENYRQGIEKLQWRCCNERNRKT